MSRRLLPLIPALLAFALPASSALAGEDPDSPSGGDGSATLHAAQSCKAGHAVKAWVTGDNIDRVAFFVNGALVNTDRQAGSSGRYRLSMSCSRLHVGANTARAVVSDTSGSNTTLRFSVTQLSQASPRFTG